MNKTDVAPRLRFIETIERMAGGNAGLAAGAGVKVDLESVLFARAGFRERNEIAVEMSGCTLGFRKIVCSAGANHRRVEALLLGEKFVEEQRQ